MILERECVRRLLKDKSEPRKVVQMLSDQEWDKVTNIVMGFKDASVAPEYHRSYSMEFTEMGMKVKVFSYGKVLNSYSNVMLDGKFEELKNILKKQRIRRVEESYSGMTGGFGGYISLMKDNEVFFSAWIYGNQRVSEGDLSFDGFLFDAPYSVFPWLENIIESLIESTRL